MVYRVKAWRNHMMLFGFLPSFRQIQRDVFLFCKSLDTPKNVALFFVGKRLNLKEKPGGSCRFAAE